VPKLHVQRSRCSRISASLVCAITLLHPYDYYTNADPYDYNGTTYNMGSADSTTVQAIQTQLLNLGYYSGSIDGVFGPTTRDAVAKYQIANHLNVTGSLSPDTLTSLGLPQATPS